MKKILLIENQYLQFRSIRAELQQHYREEIELHPKYNAADMELDRSEYVKIIDRVRVALSERYGTPENQVALNDLTDLIIHNHYHLIIIDHKLIGYDNAPTGIELATRLRDNNIRTPILFLSRTPENRSDVVERRRSMLAPYDWVSKGYSDHDLMESGYINESVITKIDRLLKHNRLEEAQFALLGIIRMTALEKFVKAHVAQLINERVHDFEFDEGQRDEILKFNINQLSHAEQKEFIQKYYQLLSNSR